MNILLRRFSALTLLSLGIALIFLPFNDERSGADDKEVVMLEKQKLLDPAEIRAQYPGLEITDIMGPEFSPDDYPGLWQVFIDLVHYEFENESGDLDEWIRLQDSALNGRSPFQLVVFREGLIAGTVGTDQETAMFKYLGRYNTHIKTLSEKNLARYPSVQHAVSILESGGELAFETDRIPMVEWDKMVDKYLEPLYDSQTFNFNGSFYGPEFKIEFNQIEGTISFLGNLLKGIGVLALLGGLFLVRKLYIRKTGIMVNPQGIALLNDGITLLFAIPSVYMVVTVLLTKTLHIPPLINDDFGIFMGVFFFCVGIPALTLYTSRFTAQSVEIDSEGIHVDSLMGKNSLTWESFKSMDFSDEYIVVGRGGMLMPRQLQKCLELKGSGGQSVTINEPQLQSVKGDIVSSFRRHAPEHLEDTIKQTLDEW